MPAPPTLAGELVLDPVERRLSDRQFALVVFGVALAFAAVIGTLLILPRNFVLVVLVLLAFPAVRVLRDAWRAQRLAGPRLVIGSAYLQAGDLRFAWRDVTDVSVGPSARVSDRRARVKVRLNRLVPVRPTDAALRAAGLELGDQYFDFSIPPGYAIGPQEIAARIEERRAELRRQSLRTR